MKNRILLVSLIFTLVALIFGGCAKPAPAPAPAPAPVKPIELSYSHLFPAGYGQAKVIEDWAAEIEKRTEGRVKFTLYPVGTLTKPPDTYETIVKGGVDIGMSALAYTRGRFPLSEVLDLPGISQFNAVITSRLADEFYRKFEPEELADTHILYLHAHIPGVFMTANKPVRTLEDIKGLRIRSTGLAAKIVEALGAVPVAMSASDAYDALQKGVVDGTVGTPNMLKGWKFGEVTKYSTIASKVGYVTTFYVAMNLDKWNSLPLDIQKVFTEVSAGWAEYTGKVWNEMEIEGYEFAKEQGHTFTTLPPEEATRWMDATKGIPDVYVKAVEAKGLPGKDALDFIKQLAEKYSKIYPPLKFE